MSHTRNVCSFYFRVEKQKQVHIEFLTLKRLHHCKARIKPLCQPALKQHRAGKIDKVSEPGPSLITSIMAC